jgi:hypothetical protein
MKTHTFIRRLDSENEQEARFYEGIAIDPKTKAEERVWCYPSVTSKLDDVYPSGFYLMKWIRDNGEYGKMEFEKSADSGTKVHEVIELLLHGSIVPTLDLEPKVKKCIASFLAWFKEAKPQILATEQIVVNHPLKYAGCADLVCKIGGNVWLIDYKTSNSIHPQHKVQVSAYFEALKGTEFEAQKAALLHLGNRTKAGYSFLEFDTDEYFTQFKHFNQTFDMLYPDAKPTETKYPIAFSIPSLIPTLNPKNI